MSDGCVPEGGSAIAGHRTRTGDPGRRQGEMRYRAIARLYALLSQIGRSIVRTPDRDDLFQDICRIAVAFGAFRMAWIGLLDEAGRVLPLASAGVEGGYLDSIAITTRDVPSGSGPTGTALREGAVVICDDIATDPRMLPWRDEALRRGYRSSAAVPFRQGDRVVGTLNLYAAEPDFFTGDERELLEELGENITFALDAIAGRQALQEREEHLRFLSENLAEGMVYQIDVGADGRQRRFTYLSPAVERLHGLRLDDVLRDPSILYGQIVPEHREAFGKGEAEAIAALTPFSADALVRLPSGELRWRRFVSAPKTRPDGHVLWSGIELDITQQKRMEEAVRRREQDLLEVQRLSGVASFTWDLRTDAVECSPEFYRVAERDAGSFPQTSDGFLGLVHPDDRERVRQAAAACVGGGPALDVEYRLALPDGREKHIASSAVVKRDADGAPLALIGFTQDVTARRRAERLQAQIEQAQRMESIGRLAGGVAHDFNNMLGVILGRAELALLEPGLADGLRESLDDICHAARRSAELTGQLLAFARRQPAAPGVLDLNDVVGGMLKMLRRLIGEGIDLVWRPGPGLWPVRIDPSQLDQIMVNLCVNARDAIAGAGRITIRTENVTLDEASCRGLVDCTPGPCVLLEVSDDGRGMSREVLDHLFEPFFTTKSAAEGTGLGLATVYGIVRQNDGHIGVTSAPGAGSTFAILLPRCPEAVAGGQRAPAAGLPRGGGETVLLVEDERALLRMGCAMLEGLGYRVLPALTPADAIRAAGEGAGAIDLLITDVVMPGMDGRDLAGRLAKLRPGIRCLFMSGHSTEIIAHQGLIDDGVAFLKKPFTRGDLAVAVHEALRRPGTTGAA